MLHFNLVYKFKCNICNDIYYGKTKRYFKVRVYEHLGIIPLTGKKVKSPGESVNFIIFSMWVITKVLMILKPLSKSLLNLDPRSESRFWLCVMIHIWIDMLSPPSLWNFFHNNLQFSLVILIIVVTILIIWPFDHYIYINWPFSVLNILILNLSE